jgi:hypothetical protein
MPSVGRRDVRDDEGLVVEAPRTAETLVPLELGDVETVPGLQPHPVLVHEADHCDRYLEDPRGERRDAVELCVRGAIEEVVVPHCCDASGLRVDLLRAPTAEVSDDDLSERGDRFLGARPILWSPCGHPSQEVCEVLRHVVRGEGVPIEAGEGRLHHASGERGVKRRSARSCCSFEPIERPRKSGPVAGAGLEPATPRL